MDVVVFTNPFTHQMQSMRIEMVNAYVDATNLHMQEAARVSCIRDQEEADNLLLSIADEECAYDEPCIQCIHSTCKLFPEGCGFDRLSVPFPY